MLRKLILACMAFILSHPTANAQISDNVVRIGVLTDLSGPYADTNGKGDVVAVRMAVAEFNATVLGKPIEVIVADHQNQPDTAAGIARKWFDIGGVDVIIDLPNSSVALAVNEIARQKQKVVLATGPATSDLTGKACSPMTIHWTYDTWMLANTTGKALTKSGGINWFFLTSDYAFGQALERDTRNVVAANGGTVVGAIKVPLNTSDFSSFLLQAQASKANIIGLANAGADAVNSIKQAHEFGIVGSSQRLAGLLVGVADVKALGLSAAQGLLFSETFYWDINDETRTWSEKFGRLNEGVMPSSVNAGAYSATLHYLKAIAAAGTDDGPAVVSKMKELPTDDVVFGKGAVRADGRKIHAAYLLEVKAPSESSQPWDIARVRSKIPADEAFRPLEESECPLLKQKQR